MCAHALRSGSMRDVAELELLSVLVGGCMDSLSRVELTMISYRRASALLHVASGDLKMRSTHCQSATVLSSIATVYVCKLYMYWPPRSIAWRRIAPHTSTSSAESCLNVKGYHPCSHNHACVRAMRGAMSYCTLRSACQSRSLTLNFGVHTNKNATPCAPSRTYYSILV